jgi:tripartite-type tricarboxylate transporter receptor subunit TctC
MAIRPLAVLLAAALLVSPLACPLVHAQPYPAKPIRYVIPLPPGGLVDIVARTIANPAAEKLGTQFIYDYKPGANTILATQQCVAGSNDGYTACFITSNLTVNQFMYSKLPYDYVKDIEPVTNMVFPYEVLLVNPTLPVKTLRDLVDYSKAHPGTINYGSLGIGASAHLVPSWIAQQTGASFTHIPYKSIPDIMRAFLAGEIHMTFLGIGNPGYIDNVKSGRMRALFFPGEKRNPMFPDVPAMSETGVPDHGYRIWWGLGVPAGTSKDIIGRLNSAFVESLRQPAVSSKLISVGCEPVGDSPEEFRKFMLDDRAKGERLVKASGAKLD